VTVYNLKIGLGNFIFFFRVLNVFLYLTIVPFSWSEESPRKWLTENGRKLNEDQMAFMTELLDQWELMCKRV
jgi:hypothetical protein